MNNKSAVIVRYKADNVIAYCTEGQKILQALTEKSDASIDYSDIPPLIVEQWSKGIRGRFSGKK